MMDDARFKGMLLSRVQYFVETDVCRHHAVGPAARWWVTRVSHDG